MLDKLLKAFNTQGDPFSEAPLHPQTNTHEVGNSSKQLHSSKESHGFDPFTLSEHNPHLSKHDIFVTSKIIEDVKNKIPTATASKTLKRHPFLGIFPFLEKFFQCSRDKEVQKFDTFLDLIANAGIGPYQISRLDNLEEKALEQCKKPENKETTCTPLAGQPGAQICRDTARSCIRTVKTVTNSLEQYINSANQETPESKAR